MNRYILLALVLTGTMADLGCARPSRIETFRSPKEDVFFTVETYYGHGALSADFTKVYAHLESDGRASKMLVLEGDNLMVANVVWNGPHDDIICLSGGITSVFHNQVTLILGDRNSETIYNHLQEHCP